MKRKKILYSISGHCRTYKSTLQSHLEMVVFPLSNLYEVEIKLTIYDVVNFDDDSKIDEKFILDIFKDFHVSINYLKQNHLNKRTNVFQDMFFVVQESLQADDKYDFLIRSRPDLIFLSAIDENELNHVDFDIAFPKFANWLNGRNDQFFILNMKNEKCKNFKIFDFLQKEDSKHPETLLKKYIDSISLKERFLFSINYVILRSNNRIDDQRNSYRM